MDPILHTAYAASACFVTFHLGHFFGRKRGFIAGFKNLCVVLNAKDIIIDEEFNVFVVYNDETRKKIS